MKYKDTVIKEDNEILNVGNDYQIARVVGCSPSYINMLRKGRAVANGSFYTKLKRLLTN